MVHNSAHICECVCAVFPSNPEIGAVTVSSAQYYVTVASKGTQLRKHYLDLAHSLISRSKRNICNLSEQGCSCLRVWIQTLMHTFAQCGSSPCIHSFKGSSTKRNHYRHIQKGVNVTDDQKKRSKTQKEDLLLNAFHWRQLITAVVFNVLKRCTTFNLARLRYVCMSVKLWRREMSLAEDILLRLRYLEIFIFLLCMDYTTTEATKTIKW